MRSNPSLPCAAHGARALLLILGMAACSCSVSYLASSATSTTNSCESDTDCGLDATCSEGACFARSGSMDRILLEFVPETVSTATPSVPGVTYFEEEQHLTAGARDVAIEVPTIPTINGRVVDASKAATDCNHDNQNAIPARVTFTRTAVLNDIPVLSLQPLVTELDTAAGQSKPPYGFSSLLAPGTYDIYVEPSCAAAPMLFAGIQVDANFKATDAPATLTLPTPSRLSGTVRRSDATPLSDWEISIIEPSSGRRISTTQTLGRFGGGVSTNFAIDYQPVRADRPTDAAGSPIIQIRPSDGPAPTTYWDLYAVDLDGDSTVDLDMSGVPVPNTRLVEVTGKVLGPGAPDKAKGVESMLFFFSKTLDGSVPNAVFNTNVPADQMGHYIVGLFPGDYRILVLPGRTLPVADAGDSLVSVATDYSVAEQDREFHSQTTFDIQLLAKVVLEGSATTAPRGLPALGATVKAESAIRSQQVTVRSDILSQSDILPSAPDPVFLSGSANFRVPIDPGDWDITVRPATESNLPWWVYPGLTIADPSTALTVALQPRVPLPIPFEGRVIGSDRDPPQRGTLRAFALTPDGKRVVQVGAAHTNTQGAFQLLLPSAYGGTTTSGGS